MKILLIILSILFVSMFACSSSSVAVRDGQITNGIKPLMEKKHDEQKINISVPVYNF
ncbi:MAG: hypothetical protein V1874_06765 [Spirochaetota bacterium]